MQQGIYRLHTHTHTVCSLGALRHSSPEQVKQAKETVFTFTWGRKPGNAAAHTPCVYYKTTLGPLNYTIYHVDFRQ